MSREKPARYRLIAHPDVPNDLAALTSYGADVIEAARDALDDLAHGRVTGKMLGERRVSGDLTGLATVKFDLPGSPTRRFRLIYAIYRLAVQRFQVSSEQGSGRDESTEPPSP